MSTILECSSLSKRFDAKFALNEVNLTLESGKIIGLLGSNGSGKTTLMKLIAGVLTPTAGEIKISGHAPGIETKLIVSYLPDKNSLPDWMRIGELVEMFSDFFPDFDKPKAYDMLNRLKLDSHSGFKQLSKGTKEKVQLVLAMSRNARLYLLDEPIGGVDPAARDYILETIISNYSENATVVISTHLIADIEKVLDEAVFIADGRVVLQKTVDEIREENGKSVDALFREVFKC